MNDSGDAVIRFIAATPRFDTPPAAPRGEAGVGSAAQGEQAPHRTICIYIYIHTYIHTYIY